MLNDLYLTITSHPSYRQMTDELSLATDVMSLNTFIKIKVLFVMSIHFDKVN